MVRQKFIGNPIVKLENNQDDLQAFSGLKTFLKRLTTRKTVTQLHTEAESGNELKRTLGPFQLLALGIGSIIGKLNKYINILNKT
jgi:hypothetical protein